MAKAASQERSTERMANGEWGATLSRVRAEFEEMPCMRVTPEQARALLGLSETACEWVLGRLAEEGFLARTPQGEYVRRSDAP
jgi:predicted transcriptional regulator of viral defense system